MQNKISFNSELFTSYQAFPFAIRMITMFQSAQTVSMASTSPSLYIFVYFYFYLFIYLVFLQRESFAAAEVLLEQWPSG